MEQQLIIQAPVSVEQFSPVVNWIRDAHHQVYSYANMLLGEPRRGLPNGWNSQTAF